MFVGTFVHKLQKGALHSLRQEVSLPLCVCVDTKEGARQWESGSKRVEAGSIKKEAWTNSSTLLINNNAFSALSLSFSLQLVYMYMCVCSCILVRFSN